MYRNKNKIKNKCIICDKLYIKKCPNSLTCSKKCSDKNFIIKRKIWKNNNNEYMKNYSKNYYKNHIEENKLHNKNYYKEHKDEILIYARNYNKTHKEEIFKKRRDNLEKYMFTSIKSRAKINNIDFNIEISDIKIPKKCPILNIPIFPMQYSDNRKNWNSPSLDRIDNTKGYIKGNIQVISMLANSMKHSATPKQLKSFARWVNATYK